MSRAVPVAFAAVRFVEEALERDAAVRVRGRALQAALSEGVLTLEGEVEDLASKRRAVALAATLRVADRVFDRVRVAPAAPMTDGALRDHVRDALFAEPAFAECNLVVVRDGRDEKVRDAGAAVRGAFRLQVDDGVVALDGVVPSLSHRRLAEALAWWVPGTCDVRNELAVSPPEADSDDEITDAVRLVLDKEPLLDSEQLLVDTHEGRVILRGTLPSDEQRALAEKDTWCVRDVRAIDDRIEVQLGA